VKIWDDSGGGGGRPGSIWTINSTSLVAVTAGHDAPKDVFYELSSQRFFLDENMINPLGSSGGNTGGLPK